MEYILRDYQKEAVEAGIKYFQSNAKDGAIIVAPTSSGKSLVIANICKELPGNTLVLQPSKEILEQNYEKMVSYIGEEDVGVFSASANRKDIGKITFGMIGSLINKKELFSDFSNLIIDEAHLCNAKGGQYKELIEFFGGKCVGTTGTPFRMHSYNDIRTGERAVVAKFLHRTRPKLFNKIIYNIQIQTLYEQKFLCPIEYEINNNYDQAHIKLNSTGMDFDQQALELYNKERDVINIVKDSIVKHGQKHVLVFTATVDEATQLRNKLVESNICSEIISAETPKKERENILKFFKEGHIKVVTNCGTMTTGYDFPELDCLDEKTEILTPNGWKGINDNIEEVLSVNQKTKEIETKKVTHRIEKKINDDVVSIKSGGYDVLVTKNHRMWVGVGRVKNDFIWENAKNLLNKGRFRLPISANSINQKGLPLTNDDIRFIGWFMTDGGFNGRRRNHVVICQSKKKQVIHIRKLLKRLGFIFHEYISDNNKGYAKEKKNALPLHRFYCPIGVRGKNKGKGWKYLEKYLNRKFSRELIEMSPRQFEIFWKELLRGDGTGEKRKNHRNQLCVGDMDKLSGLQDLAIRCGYATNAVTRILPSGKPFSIMSISKRKFSEIKTKNKKVSLKKYVGRVWCVQNCNETLIIRRNGHVSIVGNCVILARPTQSVGLYMQMVGRGLRIAPGKDKVKIIDVCGNIKKFGKIESFEIVTTETGLHRLKSDVSYLTGFDFISRTDLEKTNYKGKKESKYSPDIIPFGKFKGTHIAKLQTGYIEWCVANFGESELKNKLIKELIRRTN